MPQIPHPKIPLPGIVRIFILWILFLAICATRLFFSIAISESFSFFFTLVMLAILIITIAPIGFFINRSPRAVLSSQIASAFFSFLTFIASFSVVSILEKAIELPEEFSANAISFTSFIWLTAMGLMFTSALLLSFFFYVQYSNDLKKCLRITETSQKYVSLSLGSLGTLSLMIVALSLRFILGIAFFSEGKESETLPFALVVAAPHLFIGISLLICFIKNPTPPPYYKLGSWLVVSLVMMASRNYVLGTYGYMLPAHSISIFSIFLYILPNALIIALPLIWWGLLREKTRTPLESLPFPSSSFVRKLLELPLPLTIALLYVGFQGLLFAFNAVNPQLVSIASFSAEVQNTALDPSAVKQNGTLFFAIIMLPLSFACILTTLKDPYRGIGLCRIFCLLSALLHGVSLFILLSLGFSAIHFSEIPLSESSLYCFTSIVAYAAFSIMHHILLLPHEEKKESIQEEPIHSDEIITEYGKEILSTNISLEENAETQKSQKQAIPYAERVRPLLSRWLTVFLPGKDQPLPFFLFTFFCFAILAKWVVPAFLQSCTLFFSAEKGAALFAQTFFLFSLIGASFPLIGIYFAQKRTQAKPFISFLTLWVVFIIFLRNYSIVPGFSLLTPEFIGVLAMLWYIKRSMPLQK